MSHAKLEVRMDSLLPFLQGTCTPYNMPVYPGAQCVIAETLIDDFGHRANYITTWLLRLATILPKCAKCQQSGSMRALAPVTPC